MKRPLAFYLWAPLISVQMIFVGNARSKRRRTEPLCLFWLIWKQSNRIFWSIWKDSNRRAFENMGCSAHRIESFFLCSLWVWALVNVSQSFSPVVHFVNRIGLG